MPFPLRVGDRTFTDADFAGQGHVIALPDLAQALIDHVTRSPIGTATNLVALAPGDRLFQTQPGLPFAAGVPLLALDAGDPKNSYLLGKVTSYDADTGDLVLDVEIVAGGGTSSAWSIHKHSYDRTGPVTPPGSIAEGYTGATSAQGVRNNFELLRRWIVIDARPSPPATPADGDQHLVTVPAFGQWAGHENEIAAWVEATGKWEYEVADETLGDLAWRLDVSSYYRYTSGGWLHIGDGAQPAKLVSRAYTAPDTLVAIPGVQVHNSAFTASGLAQDLTFVLPAPDDPEAQGARCLFHNADSTRNVIVDAAANAPVVGQPSQQLAPGESLWVTSVNSVGPGWLWI
ncbi:MAG: DUF2793 domain-containing protein [Acidobacteriota bacterium]